MVAVPVSGAKRTISQRRDANAVSQKLTMWSATVGTRFPERRISLNLFDENALKPLYRPIQILHRELVREQQDAR